MLKVNCSRSPTNNLGSATLASSGPTEIGVPVLAVANGPAKIVRSAPALVTPVVIDFLARYPEASVDLRSGHVMIDMVEEAFDLAISPFLPPDASLVRRRLGTWSLMVCGAPAYLEKHPAPRSPADLAGQFLRIDVFPGNCGQTLELYFGFLDAALAPFQIAQLPPGAARDDIAFARVLHLGNAFAVAQFGLVLFG